MAVTASKSTGKQTWAPTPKLTSGSLSAAVVVIIVWIYNTHIAPGSSVDPTTASALTTIVGSIAAYLTPPSPDQIVLTDLQETLPDNTSRLR